MSVRQSVGRSVGPAVTFCERFSHYCSCPTVRDWIAVYPALLNIGAHVRQMTLLALGPTHWRCSCATKAKIDLELTWSCRIRIRSSPDSASVPGGSKGIKYVDSGSPDPENDRDTERPVEKRTDPDWPSGPFQTPAFPCAENKKRALDYHYTKYQIHLMRPIPSWPKISPIYMANLWWNNLKNLTPVQELLQQLLKRVKP